MESDFQKRLRIDLTKHFGHPIEKLAHLKTFHEAIEVSTNKNIGFNTLRRFFGFLEGTSPNINTLNTLSQYLGYLNFSAYQKNYLKDNEWFIWSQVIKIELSDIIYEEDIYWLQSQINTPDYHLKLASIIKTFIYKKKYKTLNQFFDTRIFQFDEPNRMKFATNICLLFRSLNSKDINEIIKKLTPNIIFRENVLHWFIDYSYLNNYYGSFLQETSKYVVAGSHESLFCDLMLNYNHFLTCKNKLNPVPIDLIKDDYFIILKGRCYAYNLIYFNETNNNVEYKKTWNNFLNITINSTNINRLSLEIFVALLLLKDFDKTKYLIHKYYEDLLTLTNWSSHHIQATILFAQIIDSIKENKLKEAKMSFDLINPSKFGLSYYQYIMLIYLIVKYQLGIANQSSEIELKEIENEYLSNVAKTGFKRFTLDFLKNYL